LYIFVYCLLHRLLRPILQSGGCIMYSYTFHIMKYFLYCICVIFCANNISYLNCERLRMSGLDDYNILQPGYLVGHRLGGMHDSISVQNLSLHGFACTSSQAMSHMTKEHLAWHDLRQTRVSRGTQCPCNSDGSRSSNVWLGELGLYATQP
jgi:hypothetical protein